MIQLNVAFQSRSFDPIPSPPYTFLVEKLTWTAQGGPDQAFISSQIPSDQIFSLLSLLRAPVIVSNCFSNPAWWGYVAEIHIHHHQTTFKLSLDDLFNKVKVTYSYISPDNIAASPLIETDFAHNIFSQSEYGVKERVLYRSGIDDDFALALRDTFLEQSSKPNTSFMPFSSHGSHKVILVCRGWFSTLSWRFHQDLTGYYANHGPGPGMINLGTDSITSHAQQFISLSSGKVKYVYFLLRQSGSPAANLQAHIYSHAGNSPDAKIGSSASLSSSSIEARFTWIKFTFPSPVSISSNTNYWSVLTASGTDASKYYSSRIDSDRSFNQVGKPGRYYKAGWKSLPLIPPSVYTPCFYFRVVTVQDTGDILHSISTDLGQFFTSIHTLSTGVNSCPYNDDNLTAFDNIIRLMNLGTSNQRPVLANVDVDRRLTFYEAPDPSTPTVSMDPQGRFFSSNGQLIPPYMPPIGQYAILSGTNYFAPPFDDFRTPNYFVDKYTFFNS
jgi:hypothetical protein